MDIPGFGQEGQEKLRNTTALVSRTGGLGGPIALQLAAAGIGKLVLAHGGNLQPSDLNRQVLMRHGSLGQPRIESARETLQAFNPHITVETVNANINEENAEELVGSADIVFDAAPRFNERFLLNRQCVRQRKSLIDAAMFSMEGQVVTIVPGLTPCLACLYPEEPPHWNRRFPVLGAVSSLIANIAVVQGICLLTGIGDAHLGKMIYIDTAGMNLRKIAIQRRIDCAVCQSVPSAAP
ncbi:MAG: HesA/MoeB/ThiF family protein [Pirellulales bacterium]|nr:HesA/MoeB/ThiF family protein [Pirellulales bacterium]